VKLVFNGRDPSIHLPWITPQDLEMEINENGIGHGPYSVCVSMALLPFQGVTATDIRFHPCRTPLTSQT
jgi:hypothetical protein